MTESIENIPQYTSDWFSNNISTWNTHLGKFKDESNLNFLEIGCWEGRSSRWLLENILTNDSSKLTCIDIFQDSDEYSTDMCTGLYDRFCNNIDPYKSKVTILKHYSSVALKLESILSQKFDFIYIDACHLSRHVLEDAILAFPLLKTNGIMIFDDYLGGNDLTSINFPKTGIDSFLKCYKGLYEDIFSSYQYGIRKIV
jgi:SAM-dependent methyltransferase